MIKSFAHKGLERFFRTGAKGGIQPAHASRLRLILTVLNGATASGDMALPGLGLHPLKGKMAGLWAVSVGGNYRVTFGFEGRDAVRVDYIDYH
ncbi:MAG TPA: type II toxin-antitoxin system RelE/ParE family toxin [Candidatus Binataceae bacterium]|nr:type II toxin-antitoxin system RelE/ParE family toxin [Candidatus Binataceae bacterium]